MTYPKSGTEGIEFYSLMMMFFSKQKKIIFLSHFNSLKSIIKLKISDGIERIVKIIENATKNQELFSHTRKSEHIINENCPGIGHVGLTLNPILILKSSKYRENIQIGGKKYKISSIITFLSDTERISSVFVFLKDNKCYEITEDRGEICIFSEEIKGIVYLIYEEINTELSNKTVISSALSVIINNTLDITGNEN